MYVLRHVLLISITVLFVLQGTNGPRDLRELGEGYDQNDPFVDDSESVSSCSGRRVL